MVTIRQGSKEDLPAVLVLIRELAVYEKSGREVEITLAELAADGFGKAPSFFLLVAEVEREVVGMALYYYKYSTWKGRCLFLEDLVVRESLRGKGIGKALFEAVAGVAKKEKVKRMEWQVLDWNQPAIDFYKKYQAHFDGEWYNSKLVFEQLQQGDFPDVEIV